VRSTHAGLADDLRWYLAPFRRPRYEEGAFSVQVYVTEEDEGENPPPYSLFIANERKARLPSVDYLLKSAKEKINHFTFENVRAFLALHAGSVATREGALLLPAPPDTGKTTMVAALIEQGFAYLSDEVGAIDPVTTKVYPFPRRLDLDPKQLELFPNVADRVREIRGRQGQPVGGTLTPEDLDAEVSGPAPPRYLVFMAADREGPPRLTPIRAAEAVERMAANCFNLYRYEERGVILLTRVAKNAEAFRLDGGTARERTSLLTERFA
jgi:hypothetical protein